MTPRQWTKHALTRYTESPDVSILVAEVYRLAKTADPPAGNERGVRTGRNGLQPDPHRLPLWHTARLPKWHSLITDCHFGIIREWPHCRSLHNPRFPSVFATSQQSSIIL
jgi:hypothetical protein